jgi:hypothetical protein
MTAPVKITYEPKFGLKVGQRVSVRKNTEKGGFIRKDGTLTYGPRIDLGDVKGFTPKMVIVKYNENVEKKIYPYQIKESNVSNWR